MRRNMLTYWAASTSFSLMGVLATVPITHLTSQTLD
jgi:hypothetical protein